MTILAAAYIGLTCLAQHVQSDAVKERIVAPLQTVIGDSEVTTVSIVDERIADHLVTWFELTLHDKESTQWRVSIRVLPSSEFGSRYFQGFLPPGMPTPFGDTVGFESATYEDSDGTWRAVHFRIGNSISCVSGPFSRYGILIKAKILATLLSQEEVTQSLRVAAQLYETEQVAKKAEEEARKAATEAANAESPEEFAIAVDKLMGGDSSKAEERRLAGVLRRARSSAALPLLMDRAGPGHFYKTRVTAIDALGKIGDQAAVPALMEILERPGLSTDEDKFSEDAIPRRRAVIALREINDPAAVPLLKRIAANESEYPSVRATAENAAYQMELKNIQRSVE